MRTTTWIIPQIVLSIGLLQAGMAWAEPYPERYWAEEAASGEAPWIPVQDADSESDRIQQALDKGQDLSRVVEAPAAGAGTATSDAWPHRYRNEGNFGMDNSDVALENPQ